MTPAEFIARLRTQVGKGEYQLGAGGWDPKHPDTCFHPHWDTKNHPGVIGCDCSAYALKYGLKLDGHRPGFGRGPGSHVEDYINSDSALYDAIHNHDIFELVEGPPDPVNHVDFLILPSYFDKHTGERKIIGHVMAVAENHALEWQDHDVLPRPWELVNILQCRGPNGKRPGVIASDASLCTHHDSLWPNTPAMWTQVIRVRDEFLTSISP